MTLIDGKIYSSECEVKYLFKKSLKGNKNLIIIFSGFSAVGKPPAYNYMRTLNNIDCNKLFILDDFGSRASYYLCENKDFYIERSVFDLIQHIIQENNINNIISCGSSKGGYAALYYGIKYGFNHIIAGSPQTLLAEYLLKHTNTGDVAEFIAGGIEEEHVNFLNNVLFDTVGKHQQDNKPNIYIHVGKGEYHYKTHVLPFIELLNKYHYPYHLDLGDYDTHADVAKYFPSYLENTIKSTLGYPIITRLYSNLVSPQRIGTNINFTVDTIGEKLSYAWYVYKEGERVQVKWYSERPSFDWTPNEPGKYQIKAFVQNKDEYKASIISDEYVIE